jgi:hypothetical protein
VPIADFDGTLALAVRHKTGGAMKRTLLFACVLALCAVPDADAASKRGQRKIAGVSILNHQPSECPDSEDSSRCEIPVLAYPPIDEQHTCTIKYLFSPVSVARGKTPKIVWLIVKADPDDESKYRFAAKGINWVKTNGVENDPMQDFSGGDFDEDSHHVKLKHRYTWRSVNARAIPLNYEITVLRKPPRGSWDDPEVCTRVDPTINNGGP